MRSRLLVPLSAGLAAALALVTRDAPAQQQVDPSIDVEAAEPSLDESSALDDVAGEIAVDVRDDASEADIADLAARYGVRLRANSGWSAAHDKLEVADVDPAQEDAILAELSRDPRVEDAEPMALFAAAFVPNDPLYTSQQWHLKHVGAETAWNYTCGQGVTVAVVDTGIACFDKGPFSRGTDLAGTRCEGGWNFVDNSAQAYDDQGHGTHVAGTIAQTTNNGVGTAGLAFCATLMPVKVLNKQGFGTTANVAEGIRFAADEGAQVINLSLGGPIKSRILQKAVEHALEKGVVVVAAAGNSGRSVGWPAAYPGVIAVSATDSNDRIATFSSRGPEVVLAAPGVGVTQQTICNGGRDKCEIFGTFNGTSMASPHVAGIAAMVESLGVTRGSSVRDALTSTAHAKGDPAQYGAGVVDAASAASHVFWDHFLVRMGALLGLLGLVSRRIRKRGGSLVRSPIAAASALAASVGLFAFAPLVGGLPHVGRYATALALAMRPVGEWDLLLLGAGAHRWLLLASALPVIGATALGFASRRLRPLIGGLALGTAALLVQMAWSGDAAFVGGAALARAWEIANVFVCLWIARLALDGKRA